MCGRYVRRSDEQKIADHIAVHDPSAPISHCPGT